MKQPFALADREVGVEPRREDFGSAGDYEAAWYFWAAVRRDAYPTPAELDALHDATKWAIDRRWPGC